MTPSATKGVDPNDIDRALREDRSITPSPGFTGRVMRAVRLQAEAEGWAVGISALAERLTSFSWRRISIKGR